MEFVTFRLRRDGLGRVTDLFAAIEDTPPFLDVLGDFFRAAHRDYRRGGAELALDEQNVHQAPEKHDGNADGSLNKHAVEHIW